MNDGARSCGISAPFRIVKTLLALTKPSPRLETNARAARAIGAGTFSALVLFALLCSGCASHAPTRVIPTAAPANLNASPEPSAAPPRADTPTSAPPLRFDGEHAWKYLQGQMQFGARPAGSLAVRATGDYILRELQANGWQTETQEFDFRGVPLRNLIAKTNVGQGPLVIVGAHYDTRPRADQDKQNPNAPVPGANDGASGVAVLLELARTLDKAKLHNEVWLAFFDAEDNGGLNACDLRVAPQQTPAALCDTNEWSWSIGAQHVAENLPRKPEAVIVVDMIGDADQNIYYEQNSDRALQTELWDIAARLGYAQWFIPQFKWSMSDDHTPFLQKGIRAADLIDFDYAYWHTTQDTTDKVSADSLERVGRVVEAWLEGGAIVR